MTSEERWVEIGGPNGGYDTGRVIQLSDDGERALVEWRSGSRSWTNAKTLRTIPKPFGGEPLRVEEMVRPELEAWEGTKTADAEALFWRIKRQGGRVFAKQQPNGSWRVWVRLHEDQGEAMGEAATRDAALFDAWKKYKRGGDLEETPQGGEPLPAEEAPSVQGQRLGTLDDAFAYARKHITRGVKEPWLDEATGPSGRLVFDIYVPGPKKTFLQYRFFEVNRVWYLSDRVMFKSDVPASARVFTKHIRARETPRGGEPLPNPSAPTSAKEEIPVEDAVPWVKITRDPELYAAGIARAKAIGPIDDGAKVYELLAPALAKEDQEVFLAVFLNVRQQCIGVTEIHRGERSRVAVSRADVLRGVVKTGADHFIIVHNHPSGDPTPSPADRKLTTAMMEGADKVDIPCIDHVVIGMGKYYSFAKGKVVKVRA